jgi:hypothetical protein
MGWQFAWRAEHELETDRLATPDRDFARVESHLVVTKIRWCG